MIANGKIVAFMVEDNADLCQMFYRPLEDAGVTLTCFPDSDQVLKALHQVHLAKFPLDVFLTDNFHPGIPGPELIRKVRDLPDEWTMQGGLRIRHIPIIMQTATARPDNIKEIDDQIPVLLKPFLIEDLVGTIDKAVRGYRDRILNDLHHVGLAVTWQGGRMSLCQCYAIDKSQDFETKYFSAIRPHETDVPAQAYWRFVVIEDRHWSAEQAVAEFEALLNSNSTKERDFQHFFQLHPEFLYQNCFIDHWAEPTLKDGNSGEVIKPDFILKSMMLPHRPWSWQVVDLKRHNVPLLSSRRFHARLSHHVHSVVAQLRDYSEYFDNPANRREVERRFGSFLAKPKLMAIIGRIPKDGALEQFSKLRSRLLDVSIVTYDEILEFRRCQVERRRRYRL